MTMWRSAKLLSYPGDPPKKIEIFVHKFEVMIGYDAPLRMPESWCECNQVIIELSLQF